MRDLLTGADELDDEIIAFVPDGAEVDLSTPVLMLDYDEHLRGADGYHYFLEGENIKESILVWSLWRGGREPDLKDKFEAVLFYATNDAFLPVEQ
jgi:hypothetical protein